VRGSGDTEYETRTLTGAGRVAAERLSTSYRDAPHFSVSLSVEASALLAAIRARQVGEPLTVTAAIASLTVRALVDHPALNAHFVGGELRLFRAVHLGVAVALEDGLIVPVIRDAHRKSTGELQRELADIVRNARSHRLDPSALGGSTFTVSNLGMFGIDRFTAILNPPEVGILAVGRCRELPTVVDGEVVARPIIDLTLCADHRAIDGAKAASFLTGLADLVRDPALLTHRETDQPPVASS
jgi:pyruvate dehydrogenase E2 component (dihydrolipoamide acetyltransferase)